MRRYLVYVLLGAAFVAFGCSEERVSAPPAPQDDAGADLNAQAVAWAIVEQACWPVEASEDDIGITGVAQCHSGHYPINSYERTPITGDIVHYSVHVPVGPGQYDVIGIHRVVRERRPYVPIHTRKAVFLQHGACKDFTGMFLPGQYSEHMADDFGMAVYLAEQDVDVWGIDQAWNLVPAGVDLSFMADWGFQRQIDDLETGMAVARWTRAVTGNGLRPMILLGYSFGAQIGYGLLNEETQMPRGRRQVEGFIPVDFAMKTDSEAFLACAAYWLDYYTGQLAAGIYGESSGMREISYLAQTDPDGDSPIFGGLTNWEAMLFLGAGQVFGEDLTFHYLAGVWDEEDEFWSGFQFVTIDQWLDFMETAAPAEPNLMYLDQARFMLGDMTPWDDYFAEIIVPVFYIAANGGGGTYFSYNQTLIGSTDKTELIVTTNPPEGVLFDFAHIDMFIGYNAPTLVWQPILEWIEAH